MGTPGSIHQNNETPQRSENAAASSSAVALIERAKVMGVNIRDYTVDVRMFNPPHRVHLDIPFMTPYCNFTQGEGINFMPEVGSECWVSIPEQDRQIAIVIGWSIPLNEGGGYRGNRPLLNPGDIHLSTRDNNFLVLRRGGIVQVGATPVCQRLFIPIRNIIRDYAENYELSTPGGDLLWNVERKDGDGGGHQRTTLAVQVKEYADDPNGEAQAIALLKLGSHGEGKDTILTIQTLDKGGGGKQTTLTINKSGEIAWEVNKFSIQVHGDFSITLDGMFSLVSKMDVSVTATGSMNLAAANISLAAGGMNMSIGGSGAGMSGSSPAKPFKLSDDAQFPVMRLSPDFIAWMAAVTGALAGVGPASKVPLVPPVQHQNPKVKA